MLETIVYFLIAITIVSLILWALGQFTPIPRQALAAVGIIILLLLLLYYFPKLV